LYMFDERIGELAEVIPGVVVLLPKTLTMAYPFEGGVKFIGE
jgi:hypothetical protein